MLLLAALPIYGEGTFVWSAPRSYAWGFRDSSGSLCLRRRWSPFDWLTETLRGFRIEERVREGHQAPTIHFIRHSREIDEDDLVFAGRNAGVVYVS